MKKYLLFLPLLMLFLLMPREARARVGVDYTPNGGQQTGIVWDDSFINVLRYYSDQDRGWFWGSYYLNEDPQNAYLYHENMSLNWITFDGDIPASDINALLQTLNAQRNGHLPREIPNPLHIWFFGNTTVHISGELSADDMRSLFDWLQHGNLNIDNVDMSGVTRVTLDGTLDDAQMGYLSTFLKKNYITELDMSQATLPGNNIPDNFAQNSTRIEKVIFGSNIGTIGESAFQNCTNLSQVTGTSPTELKPLAFADCPNLETVTTDRVGRFGDQCFQNCTKLQAPNFDGANWVGYRSFYNCDALDNPNMHFNHITFIGDEAFSDCDNLKTLVFPKNQSFTTLNTGVCADCPNLEAVTIYNEVTKIDSRAFQNCPKLNDITFEDPSRITTIAPEAFKNCAAITNACDGLSHVQKLGWSAFEGCTNLSEQAIRSILTGFVSGYNDNSTDDTSVTNGRIPSRAFKNCSNMPASPLGTAILPSTSWSGEQWKAYATAYTNYDLTTSFQYHNVVDENIKPSADAYGNEWYALDYDITTTQAKQPYTNTNSGETSTYYYSWKELDGPFSNNGNNWGFKEEFVNENTKEGVPANLGCGNLEDHAAEIFIRREFRYTGDKNGVIILTWGHDDEPCEYYLNGHQFPVQAGHGTSADYDGDGGMWWTHAIYTLTEDQKEWLKNDGTKNVLAFRVHQNWGGCQADCGLYIDSPDENSTILGNDADVFGWQCAYTDSQPADKDGKTWKDVGYSEADWTAGFGSFGSTAIKPGNIKTQWPEKVGADRWVRRHIYLTANDVANKANDTWTLRYLLDDTMEMYLNGTLIKSVNNVWQTKADDWQIVKLSSEQKNLLHEGDNVVAIKLHNAGGSCFFDFAIMKQERDIDLSVNSNISIVGTEAFDGCNLISSINLGNVTTLEDGAFASADKVTKITVNTVDAPNVGTNALDSGIDPNHCQVVFVGLCDSLYTDYHNEQTFRRLLTKTLDEAAAYYDVVPQRHAIVNLKRKFTHGWNTLALPFGIKLANGQSAALYEQAICGVGYADNYATDKANNDAFSIAAYRGLRYNQTNPDNSVFTFLEINRSDKATDKIGVTELDEFEPLLIWVPQRVIDRQNDNTLYTFNDINLNFDDGGSHGKKLYQPYQLPGFVSSEGEPFWGLYDASATYFNGNDRTHYAFVGTFSTKTSDMHADAIRDGDAFIQKGKFFTATIPDKTYRMKGYRGWFRQIIPLESESKASTYDIAVFRSEGDDAPTRITTLDGERLHDVVPFDIYDMNGRKVRTGVTSTQGLTKGIYIANGKKIVIK